MNKFLFSFLFSFLCLVTHVAAQSENLIEPNPEPYDFSYSSETEDGSISTRQESGDRDGRVVGFYTVNEADGRVRRVDYVADAGGFRATVTTNELGTESRNPADVTFDSRAPTAEQLQTSRVSNRGSVTTGTRSEERTTPGAAFVSGQGFRSSLSTGSQGSSGHGFGLTGVRVVGQGGSGGTTGSVTSRGTVTLTRPVITTTRGTSTLTSSQGNLSSGAFRPVGGSGGSRTTVTRVISSNLSGNELEADREGIVSVTDTDDGSLSVGNRGTSFTRSGFAVTRTSGLTSGAVSGLTSGEGSTGTRGGSLTSRRVLERNSFRLIGGEGNVGTLSDGRTATLIRGADGRLILRTTGGSVSSVSTNGQQGGGSLTRFLIPGSRRIVTTTTSTSGTGSGTSTGTSVSSEEGTVTRNGIRYVLVPANEANAGGARAVLSEEEVRNILGSRVQ